MSQDERQDFWRGRRVFVTGCTGFLGSWLTAALLERGASVVGLVREREPQSELVRSGLIGRIEPVSYTHLDVYKRQAVVDGPGDDLGDNQI